jgi:anthranilate synthase component 2
MPEVYHGIESEISILKPDDMLFKSLPESLSVGRYHSWAIEPDTLSEDLEITAVDGYGIPMAISHRKFDVKGVQFHPESVMTPYGKQMLMNWLQVENKEILLPQQDSSKYSMMDRIKGHLFC